MKEWPLIGEPSISSGIWHRQISAPRWARILPQLKPLGSSLLRIGADTGLGIIKFLAAIVVAGFPFLPAPTLADAIKKFSRRLNPTRGEEFVDSGRRDHSRGVARRYRHIGVAGLACGRRADGRRHSAGQPDHVRRSRYCGIIQIGPSIILIPVIIWVWTFMGYACRAVVHGLHGAGQFAR